MKTKADVDLDDPRSAQMEEAAKKVKQYKFNSPPKLMCKAPHDKEETIIIGISKNHLGKLAKAGMKQKFMSLWYNIQGILPPVPNIGFFEDAASDRNSTKLINAHALLGGLERPCKFTDYGEDVYRYILKPEYTYEYISHMVCVARRIKAPKNSVLVVCVRFFEDYKTLDEGEIKGEIISWDWTKADNASPDMPYDFKEEHVIWR